MLNLTFSIIYALSDNVCLVVEILPQKNILELPTCHIGGSWYTSVLPCTCVIYHLCYLSFAIIGDAVKGNYQNAFQRQQIDLEGFLNNNSLHAIGKIDD